MLIPRALALSSRLLPSTPHAARRLVSSSATPSPAAPSAASSPPESSSSSSSSSAGSSMADRTPDDRALPAPEPQGQTTKLDVSGGGTTVKLDALGPLVVNQDGTVARVANWTEMTEFEKQNTLRILGKRNKLRLDALRGESQDASKEESKGDTNSDAK